MNKSIVQQLQSLADTIANDDYNVEAGEATLALSARTIEASSSVPVPLQSAIEQTATAIYNLTRKHSNQTKYLVPTRFLACVVLAKVFRHNEVDFGFADEVVRCFLRRCVRSFVIDTQQSFPQMLSCCLFPGLTRLPIYPNLPL